MFNTNELNSVKLQIAQHLNNNDNQNEYNDKDTHNVTNISSVNNDININQISPKIREIPVCLLCQRCSRTIVLCQHIQ